MMMYAPVMAANVFLNLIGTNMAICQENAKVFIQTGVLVFPTVVNMTNIGPVNVMKDVSVSKTVVQIIIPYAESGTDCGWRMMK